MKAVSLDREELDELMREGATLRLIAGDDEEKDEGTKPSDTVALAEAIVACLKRLQPPEPTSIPNGGARYVAVKPAKSYKVKVVRDAKGELDELLITVIR
jgi:hypothetical protein